jgi:proteic killer suppression protein
LNDWGEGLASFPGMACQLGVWIPVLVRRMGFSGNHSGVIDKTNVGGYDPGMIKSFRCKKTERLFQGEFVSELPHAIQRLALRKLTQVHAAASLGFLRVPPGNCLEKLAGGRKGQYSIRINDQYRICFIWRNGHAYHVEITDYH